MGRTAWNKRKLCDCVSFRTGKLNSNAATKDGSYPFFTCSQEVYKTDSWAFDTECVLLGGNNASAIYPIFYFKGKFNAYQRTYVIESKDNNQIRFFYYLISKKLDELKKKSTGAATRFLTLRIFDNIDVLIPRPEIQAKIVSVLSAYDDLIENNEKRIRILEEMAQRLYAEWFVEFRFPGHEKTRMVDSGTAFGKIPEGWEIVRLGDKITVFKGKNITKDTAINGVVPVVAGGLGPAYFHKTANAKGPVVTVSASGANAGYINLYYEDIWASDCSFINQGSTPFVYFYYLLLKRRQDEVTRLQRGSAQPHVYPKDLMELSIWDIPEKMLELFESKVSLMFDELAALKKQNQNLAQTRDLLIPQLVTGKRELK